MLPVEALEREVKTLRERLSRLSQASLRINESLDVETVLQGVLDSARSLTEARYGVITTFDGSGQVEDFIASGLTFEERHQIWETTKNEKFCRIPAPRRVRDFATYTRLLGISEFRLPTRMSAFLAAPINHQGEWKGNIYLGKKEPGQEFTREDEETLAMFSSQAALVIANARRHRDEQRARADLETLIDTSPIGVMVIDGRTATPVSSNREAMRLVKGLAPELSVDQLMETMTVRRGDGSEIPLGTPFLTEALQAGDSVRAEEIVFSVPDGREITVLINATPIRSEEGNIEAYVVTLQDMKPLEEQEMLRAEFLAVVSHELRTPLAAIKGAAVTVLGGTANLDAVEMAPFFRIINQQADRMTDLIHDLLDVARIETGTLPIHPEPVSLADLVDEARNAFLSGGGRHPLCIELPPDLPRVMADQRRIVQVLGNLLDNAARHSPESTTVRITAVREGVHLEVSMADLGKGVAAERLPHLFRKFPRRKEPDRFAGEEETGLGLAICRGIVEAHGGRIWADSDGVGKGTRFTFTLPLAEEARDAPASGPARTTGSRGQAKRDGTRILVVDDDPQTLRTVRDSLRKSGFVPVVTADPGEVAGLMKKHHPQLVLLDLVLPGIDGVELMQELSRTSNAPVIFLSAYGQDEVIARAFDSGAADYMVKPFSGTELAARIRAALRKRADAGPSEPTQPFVLGELTIDYAGRSVAVSGQRVRLTDIEYRLLAELSIHAGRVVTYDHLLQRVWSPSHTDLRPLRAAVKNLRRKLGDHANNPIYLFNESRVGYRLG